MYAAPWHGCERFHSRPDDPSATDPPSPQTRATPVRECLLLRPRPFHLALRNVRRRSRGLPAAAEDRHRPIYPKSSPDHPPSPPIANSAAVTSSLRCGFGLGAITGLKRHQRLCKAFSCRKAPLRRSWSHPRAVYGLGGAALPGLPSPMGRSRQRTNGHQRYPGPRVMPEPGYPGLPPNASHGRRAWIHGGGWPSPRKLSRWWSHPSGRPRPGPGAHGRPTLSGSGERPGATG